MTKNADEKENKRTGKGETGEVEDREKVDGGERVEEGRRRTGR